MTESNHSLSVLGAIFVSVACSSVVKQSWRCGLKYYDRTDQVRCRLDPFIIEKYFLSSRSFELAQKSPIGVGLMMFAFVKFFPDFGHSRHLVLLMNSRLNFTSAYSSSGPDFRRYARIQDLHHNIIIMMTKNNLHIIFLSYFYPQVSHGLCRKRTQKRHNIMLTHAHEES